MPCNILLGMWLLCFHQPSVDVKLVKVIDCRLKTGQIEVVARENTSLKFRVDIDLCKRPPLETLIRVGE